MASPLNLTLYPLPLLTLIVHTFPHLVQPASPTSPDSTRHVVAAQAAGSDRGWQQVDVGEGVAAGKYGMLNKVDTLPTPFSRPSLPLPLAPTPPPLHISLPPLHLSISPSLPLSLPSLPLAPTS